MDLPKILVLTPQDPRPPGRMYHLFKTEGECTSTPEPEPESGEVSEAIVTAFPIDTVVVDEARPAASIPLHALRGEHS